MQLQIFTYDGSQLAQALQDDSFKDLCFQAASKPSRRLNQRLRIIIGAMRLYYKAVHDRTTSANFVSYAEQKLLNFRTTHPYYFFNNVVNNR